MTQAQARLRVFAGPNGSGKSTIHSVLRKEWIGIYVNADDIERTLKRQGRLDLGEFDLETQASDLMLPLQAYLRTSALLTQHGLDGIAERLHLEGSALHLPAGEMNSYVAAVLADFIRRELLRQGLSFTFETVMSSPDKIDFMHEAQAHGYRTYLYFVATDDPAINIERVRLRVSQGGHAVPDDKVLQRYQRSIGLLDRACSAANRAYIFDNSGEAHELIAEVTDGETLTVHVDALPAWFTRTTLWQSFEPTSDTRSEAG
ncbi:zeta toxin family protein [Aquabacterium sp. A7-Y]|uniref:zeta toxin family protein n=1 Tax=Aquabacterium sp. A7-Y TaxID=1349605 RepID=UPI00223D99B7|nr:zeta toxin family protein [Aquabacterium sp. A7-Y]MCW7540436.1 zeta toxin family protein [Aquabacterium sp. A7-Y]